MQSIHTGRVCAVHAEQASALFEVQPGFSATPRYPLHTLYAYIPSFHGPQVSNTLDIGTWGIFLPTTSFRVSGVSCSTVVPGGTGLAMDRLRNAAKVAATAATWK